MINSEKTNVTEQDTEQVNKLIKTISFDNYSGAEIMHLLKIKHRPTFLYNYLQPALKFGLIELTIPDKPNSKNQKYRLTDKGKELKMKLNS